MEDYKGYGLTKEYGKDVEDKIPEWMSTVLEKADVIKENKKEFIFSGIDDPILNPNRIGIEE